MEPKKRPALRTAARSAGFNIGEGERRGDLLEYDGEGDVE